MDLFLKSLNESQVESLLNDLKKGEFKLGLSDKNWLLKKFIKVVKVFVKISALVGSEIGEMAKVARIDDISVPLFDGENFENWKLKIMNILEYKECKDQATRERGDEQEAAWKKSDLKARIILQGALSEKQFGYVNKCSTAFEMMQKLEKMYVNKSTALQMIYRKNLDQVKLKNYESVEDFLWSSRKLVIILCQQE